MKNTAAIKVNKNQILGIKSVPKLDRDPFSKLNCRSFYHYFNKRRNRSSEIFEYLPIPILYIFVLIQTLKETVMEI